MSRMRSSKSSGIGAGRRAMGAFSQPRPTRRDGARRRRPSAFVNQPVDNLADVGHGSSTRWLTTKLGGPMATVVTHAVSSLDGFIARPDDSVGPLFDWYE